MKKNGKGRWKWKREERDKFEENEEKEKELQGNVRGAEKKRVGGGSEKTFFLDSL